MSLGQTMWMLPGDALLRLLWRARRGESPDLLLAEVYANADVEECGED